MTEPCETCGHDVPSYNDETCVERHCCEHRLPLISPDACSGCLDWSDE